MDFSFDLDSLADFGEADGVLYFDFSDADSQSGLGLGHFRLLGVGLDDLRFSVFVPVAVFSHAFTPS